jgi:hypothetical protein
MSKKTFIKATLTGKGISEDFGGFPSDLEIGKEYDLEWNFELRQYIVLDKYKANSFKWNKQL